MTQFKKEPGQWLGLHASHQQPMRKAGVTVALLALAVLLVSALPPLPETRGIAGYLPLHTLLETIAIIIAMLVFAVGWHAYRRELPGNLLLIACAFLGVGMLDFTHTISYAGMPDFVTPGSPEKAIGFWLAARTLAAITLLAVAILPWRTLTSALFRYVLLASVVAVVGCLHWLMLFHAYLLPQTFVDGQGLTRFKIYYEYVLIALNLATAAILWMRMRKPQPFDAAGLFGAVCTMALSEYLFTLYAEVSDIYNLTGHLYKVVSYLFLYRAIFIAAIERPYLQLQAAQNQLHATIKAIPDLLFEVDLEGRYHAYHSPRSDFQPVLADTYIGKTMREMLPSDVAQIGMSALQEAYKTGFAKGEYQLESSRGKRWFEFSGSRKSVEPEQAPRFVVLSRDITERKQMELELAESHGLLKAVIDAVPARIFWKNNELFYMGCNPAFAADAGAASPEEVVGKDDYQLAWKAQADIYRADDRQVMDTGIPKLFYDEPTTSSDGKITWLRTSKVALRNKDNATIGVLGLYQDITEQKLEKIVLQQSEYHLRQAQQIAHIGSWNYDLAGKLSWSDEMYRIYGVALGIFTLDVDNFLKLIHADDQSAMQEWIAACASGQKPGVLEFRIWREGSIRYISGQGELMLDADGKPDYMAGTAQDITERKHTEESLFTLSFAMEQSPNSIVITALDGRIEYVNSTFKKVTGYSLDDVLGKNPRIQQSGKTSRETYADMWSHLTRGEPWQGELVNCRKDGSEYTEAVQISPVRQVSGRVTNYLAVKQDITEKKKAEERIERLAHFDQLTGLPNRSMLNARFKFALSLAQRSGEQLALMFLDLDRFKNINDTLGHAVGDQLLMEVARRLKATLRDEDTVSRLGGDEFIIVLPGIDANGAAHVASKLLEAVSLSWQFEQHELIATPSIGIAIYPDDGKDFETLSKHADAAMYRVKQEGRNDFRFFTPEMQASSARSMQLANALRYALSRNELFLHYQPQIAIQDGRIVGAEALLRWEHPELGMISPAEFIPIAEDGGQIIQIGEWVLRTAVRQLKDWMDSGLPPMVMAVNLSAVQFHQTNMIERVTSILDEVGLPHKYLELELTEAVAMNDPLVAIAVMDRLHESGIRMSIDDFGTGYSSLSYLKKFKVSKLKIDQSFVCDITDDPEDKAIVTAIINMASSLGIRTIAEGVETSGQLAFLRLQGCDEVQGYYFSKPLLAEQFEVFARNN
ncbi:MAG: EAL domain-containing protein [Gallionella sp.]|nr:EAL domain-containing protein [Gallionella sp.]